MLFFTRVKPFIFFSSSFPFFFYKIFIFDFFFVIAMNIFLCTLFAFFKVSVTHLWVAIELRYRK